MPNGTFVTQAVVVRPKTTTSAIKRAIVNYLRHSSSLKTAATGIHEGFAPAKATYPFVTYDLVYAPIRRQWGAEQYITGFDIRVFSGDGVEAGNIDTLLNLLLDDAELDIEGQSTLLCHRVADLGSPDVDEEGRKVYMVGGTYEVWTDLNL